ncbi:hypothetical protein F4774DRAFT_150769 [Daldinia eschscholtzii]|nr:hypothetical protein F4774DRAFT_150769 [Daldinia eschscholtzii]
MTIDSLQREFETKPEDLMAQALQRQSSPTPDDGAPEPTGAERIGTRGHAFNDSKTKSMYVFPRPGHSNYNHGHKNQVTQSGRHPHRNENDGNENKVRQDLGESNNFLMTLVIGAVSFGLLLSWFFH